MMHFFKNRKFLRQVATILLSINIMVINSCGPTAMDAAMYNDSLVKQQHIASELIEQYYHTFRYRDTLGIETQKLKTRLGIDSCRQRIDSLSPFYDQGALRQAGLELINSYLTVIDQEYDSMLHIYKLPARKYTIERMQRFEHFSDTAQFQLSAAIDSFKLVQEQFAEKFKIELREKDF